MESANPFDELRERLSLLRDRERFLREIRLFFRRRGFLEVDAPTLVPAAGMEPHLDAFEVRGTATDRRGFLPTSPEFYLKKLLAAGAPRCFSLAPSFRDELEGRSHHPEFLMLEWYRPGERIEALVEDCSALLARLGRRFLPGGRLERGETTCDFTAGVEVLELSEAWRRWAGADWRELHTEEAWQAVASDWGADAEGWSPNDCFSYVSLERIEPALASLGRPAILCGYPPFQGALARERAGEPGVIDRFELFAAGAELANAYQELTDGTEQRRRYAEYQAEREALGRPAHPPDERFFEAVDRLPECAGIALGADRLLALLTGHTVAEVRHGL